MNIKQKLQCLLRFDVRLKIESGSNVYFSYGNLDDLHAPGRVYAFSAITQKVIARRIEFIFLLLNHEQINSHRTNRR